MGVRPVSSVKGFREFFVNEGPLYTFVVVWMGINALLFATTYEFYQGKKYTWLRVIVKDGLPVARGAASVLNFNCAVILIPVCRNLINAMRGCFESVRSVRRLFDKNILFHKWCAYVICLFATIHIGAHMFNVNAIAQTDNPKADIMVNDNDTAETIAFTSVPGITGILITLPLILMVTTAVDQIRRSYFELFWYTHHLFIVFYVALMLHGASGFVHRQLNWDQHPYYDDEDYLKDHPTGSCIFVGEPGCQTTGCTTFECVKNAFDAAVNNTVDGGTQVDKGGFFCLEPQPTTFSSSRCCPCYGNSVGFVDADIVRGGPATWQWIIGPFLLYLGERFYRFYMSVTRKLQVLKIVKHNDKIPVMEVQITKIKTKAGQYAFINCADVSYLEWHPFTLTSCPRLDYISFHIRLVGDWTCMFAERCGFYRTEEEGPLTVQMLPKIALDGPFGTSSEDIYLYDVGVCVCAGIGVTPFASLLQELYLRKFSKTKSSEMRLQTIYFYWICPGFDSWGWFSNLLIEFEQKCIEMGVADFLNIRIHMSRGWSKEDAEKIIMQDTEDGDLIVQDSQGRGLQAKLNFGRPNWKLEFGNMVETHGGKEIGVFFCGPKVLSTELHRRCNEFTDTRTHKTKFFYNKENF